MLKQSSLTIRLHPADDVVIARQQLVGGTTLIDEHITIAGLVPPGHKVATRAIAAGSPVRRYNQIIGFASRDIRAGEHVHLHNLAMGAFDRDYAFGADAKPTQYVEPAATFAGIVRSDGPNAGKVGTRNYLGILSTRQLLGDGRARHRRAFHTGAPCGVSERRWRRRAHARFGLRHGHAGRSDADPPPHAGRLCEARQLRRRADRRPRLRGQPDQRAPRQRAPRGKRAAAHVLDPGHRRHGQDDRARRVDHRRDAPACERRRAGAGAGVASDGRPAVRRIGRLLGHHGQPGARCGGRPARASRRHRDPVRNAGNLRRRASAHAPRRVARRGRKARVAQCAGGRTTRRASAAK